MFPLLSLDLGGLGGRPWASLMVRGDFGPTLTCRDGEPTPSREFSGAVTLRAASESMIFYINNPPTKMFN